MSLTFAEARDEILALFKVAWDANTPAVTTTVPPLEFDNLERLDPPVAPWARVMLEHTGASQATLGVAGGRLFDRVGLVTIQIFVDQGGGLATALALGKIAVDAFEGKHTVPSDEVWFRNVRLVEVGPSEGWFQVNVLAEFTYDETK